jgi:hypothetical protein
MADENKGNPNLLDKEWQKKTELGVVKTTFHYLTDGGEKASVDAVGKIPPGPTVESIEEDCTKRDTKTGVGRLDGFKYGRKITCLVFGIDGSTLQHIMENKGPDLYNQMRTFAFKLCGISLTDDEIEKQKN